MSPHFTKKHYCFVMFCLLSILSLSSCSFPGMVSTDEQLPTVSQTPVPTQLPPVRFPQDEGAHNNLTEWWYYTGHFEAKDSAGNQRQYGFEFVIFQASRSDLPPINPAHFAITDLSRKAFTYNQRRVTNLAEQASAGTSTQGINAQVGNWSIKGKDGQDHLVASMKEYSINFNLTATKPVTLHDETGLITYGLGGFSYYYSRTRMDVAGTFVDHGQTMQVTGGQAWMDHQWGNFLALGGGGWDWYSLQLNDKSEIMLYYIRDEKGKTIVTYVGYIDPSGKNTVIPASALRSTVLETWTSPKTGIKYPSGWRLEIKHPAFTGTLTVKPVLKDQELVVYDTTGNVYWEGAVDITGRTNTQQLTGKGYVELTGYVKA